MKNREFSADNKFDGRIVEKVYLGDATELEIALAETNPITSRIPSRIEQKFDFKKDTPVLIGWNAEDCNLLSD